MKRVVGWGIAIVSLLIGFNIYYYTDTYRWQLNYQSRMMEKQLALCVRQVSDFFDKTQTNIQFLLTPHDLKSLFDNKWKVTHPQNRLEMLYDRYGENLKSLTVSDTKGNYYRIRKGSDNAYITEYGLSEPPNYYRSAILFSSTEHQIVYLQPLTDMGEIYGFVRFGIDMDDYFYSVMQHFYFSEYNYQYVLMPSADLVYYQGSNDDFKPDFSTDLLANIDHSHTLVHQVRINGKEVPVLSVVNRMVLNGSTYYIAFSMPKKELTATIVRNSFIVGIVTLGVLILITIGFVYYIRFRNMRENRIRQSQETFRKVLYYLPVGVVLTDDKNVVRLVNKAALQLFECATEEELTGCIYVDDLWFNTKSIVNKSRISVSTVRYSIQNPSGDVFVVINERIPFFFENECHHIDVFFEVSNLENKYRIEHKEKMDVKSNFIANISHELRTPLNGIIGMAEILNKMPLDEDEQSILSTIRTSANTLLILINDILDFSKIDAGKFHVESLPFNISSEIEEVIGSFQIMALRKKIKLRWHSSVHIPTDFIGDPIRFRQILNNLIGNAMKFTSTGEVVVHITRGELFNGNDALQFEVHDSGIGIKPEVIKHIFDPFWQADDSTTRRFGGTGLGTTISRQLVELMGGQIWVQSPSTICVDPEHPGSSFIFTLPLITRTLEKLLDTTGVNMVNDIKVGVVSDDAKNVKTLIGNLQRFGIQWQLLDATENSIKLLSSSRLYHVVVIDHRPDFDGLMFLQQLHNIEVDLRYLIILQSSDLPSQNANLVKRLGADLYLRKPIRTNLLREFFAKHFRVTIPYSEPYVCAKLNLLLVQGDVFSVGESNLFSEIHNYQIDIASTRNELLRNFKGKQYDAVLVDLAGSAHNWRDVVKDLQQLYLNVPIIGIGRDSDGAHDRAIANGFSDVIDDQASNEMLDRLLQKWCPNFN